MLPAAPAAKGTSLAGSERGEKCCRGRNKLLRDEHSLVS